jgi:hypothetical protein
LGFFVPVPRGTGAYRYIRYREEFQGKEGDLPDTTKSARVRYPIGAKLVLIISALLLLSLGAITSLVSVMVSRDVRVTAEDTNFNVSFRSAAEAESVLEGVRSNVLFLLDTLDSLAPYPASARNAGELFFRRNQDIAAIVPVAAPADGGGYVYAAEEQSGGFLDYGEGRTATGPYSGSNALLVKYRQNE